VSIRDIWRLRDNSIRNRVCGNQFAFTTIPFGKDLRRRSASQDAGVDQPGEADVRNVPRRAEDALKVPNCLCPVCTRVRDYSFKGVDWAHALG
jgi:hypothetical protein